MKTIWKYDLKNDVNFLNIPLGFETLSVISQRNKVVLYCLVDPDNELDEFRFDVVGTGWELSDTFDYGNIFVGTVKTHEETYVWHVFEVLLAE